MKVTVIEILIANQVSNADNETTSKISQVLLALRNLKEGKEARMEPIDMAMVTTATTLTFIRKLPNAIRIGLIQLRYK